MSAAAGILQHAIKDAVQQLEPQLLPLFGAGACNKRNDQRDEGRNDGRNNRARATQRTHTALKTLVAITRFFPEHHRVRRAGNQLEMIWAPLVHEPTGAAASKLLQYYFRLREDLLDTPGHALRRAMRELARGAIDAAQGDYDPVQAEACERRLQQLAAFTPVDEAPLNQAGIASLCNPLARLCAWQQALEPGTVDMQHATLQALHPLLLPDTLALLDHCTALCRASNWTLDYFCNSGLAHSLWQLRGIARFSGDTALVQSCDALDDQCLDMHLGCTRPSSAAVQQWFTRLFGIAQAQPHVAALPLDTSVAPEMPGRAVYERELAGYRKQIQAELHPQHATLKASTALVTLLYKLTWVFAAAEQHAWSRLCQCAYRVALQHWRIRRPLSAALQQVLARIALDPGSQQATTTLRQWRTQLLHDWPQWTDDAQRPIALRHDADHVVTLDAVPDLLSGSFTTLVQAGRVAQASATHPFAAQRSPAQPQGAQAGEPPSCQVLLHDLAAELLQELTLLEKGAAAMKVWPLEQLCTLLIAIYETHLRDEAGLPAGLLQEAHRQLVRMLDQAAAWREVQFEASLVQKLEDWLRESTAARALCREPDAGAATADAGNDNSEQALRTHLLSCLGTLAPVLERPVRLQLEAGNLQLGVACLAQLLDCLRPLIKFMLLDQSVDTRMRHAMHKPSVSTLVVSLRTTSATLVVTVGEDSHEDVLAPPELQRLQRRLPKAAGALACESRAGRGRSFTFTLDVTAGAPR
jgi:hypothetical protein